MAALGCPWYLLVPLQLAGKGALVEELLQALLGVVVAELLEGGSPALPRKLRVLCPRGVHHCHRAHRVLARLQRPGGSTKGCSGVSGGCQAPPCSPAGPPSTYLLRREMRSVKSSEYKPAAMPSRHSSAVSLGPGQNKPECPQPGILWGHLLSRPYLIIPVPLSPRGDSSGPCRKEVERCRVPLGWCLKMAEESSSRLQPSRYAAF